MARFSRRKFLEGLAASGAVAATVRYPSNENLQPDASAPETANPSAGRIDFRFAPRLQQATICFPDDAKKSLVGQSGDLRYGFANSLSVGMQDFATVCTFSLAGMQDDRILCQQLEAPHIPIVHTLIERPTATLELTAFATRHAKEGRVDNVLMTVRPKHQPVAAVPCVHMRTCRRFMLTSSGPVIVVSDANTRMPFLVAAGLGTSLESAICWEENGYTLHLPHGETSNEQPLRYFIRFPQEDQSLEMVEAKLQDPEALAAEAREFWNQWKPFGSVNWNYPGSTGAFVTSCARNIQQAREVKNGRLVFQVGPTVYRNLWIVDGNFLLEAARYLGYDKEADDGLLAEWAKQVPSGQVVAAGGGEHWKDTAIAMFTLVRQCELKQDWGFFKELEPNVGRAVDFLKQLRDTARAGNSVNGRYGLLAPGFADGGIGGVRPEFTNTVWTLAGLKAVAHAAERLGMDSLRTARIFYEELRASFLAAAKAEMVRHPNGFDYLPMLAREDPAWRGSDPWSRPRPQTAQWALSHAIFPGRVFAENDPIVRGHIALLQFCTQEDIPAETGWLWHEAVWTYNASFAAHVYLWAGLSEWAGRTFRGFLNHASPLYCWREEQPLQRALVGQDWGDMPHNWASAECVRYLRHMLVLEDGARLRLLEGMMAADLEGDGVFRLDHTPTRFGRLRLATEPLDGSQGRKLSVNLDFALSPSTLEVPAVIASRRLDRIENAKYRFQDHRVLIDPSARSWTAFWR